MSLKPTPSEVIVISDSEESVANSVIDSKMVNKKRKREPVDDSETKEINRNKRRKIDVVNDCDESLDVSSSDSKDGLVLSERWPKARKKNKLNKKLLEKWSMFVNFSQSLISGIIFSEQFNPYQATLQHVSVYLTLLKDVAEMSSQELGIHKKVLGEYLPSLELDNEEVKDLLVLMDDKFAITAKMKTYMAHTENFQSNIPGWKTWRAFVEYCLGKKTNPFHANEKIVQKFIIHLLESRNASGFQQLKKVVGIRPAENFFVHNIENLCMVFGKYLKISNCGVDILDSEPILELLLAGKHLDGRVPLKSDQISKKFTPDYDFTQYVAKQGTNFWQLELVKQILQDVSSSALDKKKAAWQLGVTEDMIDSAVQVEIKDPEFNLTLELYLKKGFGQEQMFWKELSTTEVLNQVRERKVTAKDAAFMFGVSRGKLLQKVGKIKSEEEIKEEKMFVDIEKQRARLENQTKKPTQLEKQIRMAETNLENLSDYERMRLKNLKERQALLEELNINEDKNALKMASVTANRKMPWQRVDYGTREKSGRVKRLNPQAASKAVNVLAPRKSPDWVGAWYPRSRGKASSTVKANEPISAEDFQLASVVPQVDLNVREIISSNNDYHKSVRFMNSISEEVEEVAAEKHPVGNIPKVHSKIADHKVSSYEVRCVDTCGDLVCFGDSSGGVGVFLDGRSTGLKVHNEPVTRTVFTGGRQGRGILSSSLDGTVRLTDLVKQKVTVKYSWIQSGEKEQVGWLEPWEGTNFLLNSNRNSVKRIDLRSKEVETLISLPTLKYEELGYYSQAELWKDASHDPAFGTNIGVHPVNNNLISFCHKSTVKIFDMRNISQPVETINIDQIQAPGRPYLYTRGISGADWSPVTGKYFLACPIKTQNRKDDAKQFHYPYIFDSSSFREPVQIWPAKKSPYENASFSHYFGASWCPWQEGVFLTTAVYRYNYPRTEATPSYYTVVAIDASSGAIVSEITADLDNSRYLVGCHKTRNWVLVGNARGAGDLSIYQAGD